MSLHLKLLDIDHPLTFEESKLRQIEVHALIYLSTSISYLLWSLLRCQVKSGPTNHQTSIKHKPILKKKEE